MKYTVLLYYYTVFTGVPPLTTRPRNEVKLWMYSAIIGVQIVQSAGPVTN